MLLSAAGSSNPLYRASRSFPLCSTCCLINRIKDINKVAKYRNIAGKVTKGTGILLGADILISGEVKPSHVINGAMIGASYSGIGSIVAAIWFAADLGTMGINILINGEAKGLGDIIDEGLSDYCIKMY